MNGDCKIISCKDKQWDETLCLIPEMNKDIYYTSWYYRMEEMAGHGEAFAFVYKKSDWVAFYPFMLKAIPSSYKSKYNYYDIETAYGYGGPIVSRYDADYIMEFETSFLEYCERKRVIAEFIRFHPLLKNERLFTKLISVEHNRTTVWLDLTKGEEELWMNGVSSRYRNKIRGCEKNGLKIEHSYDYGDFIKLYYETMDRDNAESFYYFDDDYFKGLINNRNTDLVYVRNTDGRRIAGAVFIYSDVFFHYHLGASSMEYLYLRPNNFMLWEGAKIGIELGCKKYHLGGGLSDDPSDTLYQFKKGFSKTYADFYIGKRIHNETVYRNLIEEWENSTKNKSSKLLAYRDI